MLPLLLSIFLPPVQFAKHDCHDLYLLEGQGRDPEVIFDMTCRSPEADVFGWLAQNAGNEAYN